MHALRTWIVLSAVIGLLAGIPPLGVAQTRPAEKPAAVDLNTASVVELEALPGVGVAMATRIVEYRQKQGGFKKVEDLMNVRGIGEKSFLKLKPLVRVSPPSQAELSDGSSR